MDKIPDITFHYGHEDLRHVRGGDWPLMVHTVSGEKTLGYPHSHDFFELAMIVNGSGEYQDENRVRYKLKPGQVFLLPPDAVHHYSSQQELTVSNIIWYPEELKHQLYDLSTTPGYHALFELEPKSRNKIGFSQTLELDVQQLEEIMGLLRHLENELNQRLPGALLYSLGLFNQILVKLCRAYSNCKERKNSDILILDKILNYIHANYSRSITNKDLERVGCMSESSIYRRFMQILGVAPAHYIQSVRLKYATKLLLNSTDSIANIALKCGFSDGNHLGAIFRSHYNIPPHKFRLRARKAIEER